MIAQKILNNNDKKTVFFNHANTKTHYAAIALLTIWDTNFVKKLQTHEIEWNANKVVKELNFFEYIKKKLFINEKIHFCSKNFCLYTLLFKSRKRSFFSPLVIYLTFPLRLDWTATTLEFVDRSSFLQNNDNNGWLFFSAPPAIRRRNWW